MIKSKNKNNNKNESIVFEHADWSVIVAHSAQAQILILLENQGKQAVLDYVHELKQLPIPDKRIYPPMQ